MKPVQAQRSRRATLFAVKVAPSSDGADYAQMGPTAISKTRPPGGYVWPVSVCFALRFPSIKARLGACGGARPTRHVPARGSHPVFYLGGGSSGGWGVREHAAVACLPLPADCTATRSRFQLPSSRPLRVYGLRLHPAGAVPVRYSIDPRFTHPLLSIHSSCLCATLPPAARPARAVACLPLPADCTALLQGAGPNFQVVLCALVVAAHKHLHTL